MSGPNTGYLLINGFEAPDVRPTTTNSLGGVVREGVVREGVAPTKTSDTGDGMRMLRESKPKDPAKESATLVSLRADLRRCVRPRCDAAAVHLSCTGCRQGPLFEYSLDNPYTPPTHPLNTPYTLPRHPLHSPYPPPMYPLNTP